MNDYTFLKVVGLSDQHLVQRVQLNLMRSTDKCMHLALTCFSLKEMKELQMSMREAIVLLKAMLGEVRTNAEEEESVICTHFNSIQVR